MSGLTKDHFDQQMEVIGSRMSGMESRMSGMELDIKDIKETVQKIDKRDKEDSDAFARDIAQLQKDVKQLKLKQI